MAIENTHMMSALRYIEAVHDIRLDRSTAPDALLHRLEKIQEKFEDEVLGNYIHEYKLSTSESYREATAAHDLEEQKEHEAELELEVQQKKTEGVLYRGAAMAEVVSTQEDTTTEADGEEQYMMYRGQKVKVEKKGSSDDGASSEVLYRGKKV